MPPAAARWTWALTAAAAILVAGAPTASAQQSVLEESVQIVFRSFKHATMNREGPLAARLIDDETVSFHEKIRLAALHMEKPELLRQPVFFQVSALSTRLYFARADIERISGRDLFAKYISIGNPGAAKAFETLTIRRVTAERGGLSALAELEHEGKPVDLTLRFFIQRGDWKIDWWRLLSAATAELEGKIGITPRTPPEVVEEVMVRDLFPALALQSGRPVTATIWTPLARRN